MRSSWLSLFIFIFLPTSSYGFLSPVDFENDKTNLKGLIFLSSFCPCSQSHVEHLNKLKASYGNFKAFGVITDEFSTSNLKKITAYYTPERFQFPLIKDTQQILIKNYQALKTPHVVLLKKQQNGTYKILYQGGISDKRSFSASKVKFLEEDLAALKDNKPLPHSHGRSLGCYIRRF